MTLLAVPIFVAEPVQVDEALARGRSAVTGGARLLEWRLDELATADDGAAAALRLVADSPAPCIVTCRVEREGGFYTGDDTRRLTLLDTLLRADRPPRYVDVELSAWRADPRWRERFGPRLRDPSAGATTGLILSTHDFEGRPADLLQRLEAMLDAEEAAVLKLAWRARSLRDNLEAFDLLAERRRPMIALCMGEFGLASRVLAPKFGAHLTFASLDSDSVSAPGQPTLRAVRDAYRFDAIGRDTRVYGVVGWPVTHSRSPLVHNAGFTAVGHDAVYLPLPVPPEYEHFKATIGALVDHPRLAFAGASVTIPHKTHLRRFVEERGGRVDAASARAGAANTLVVGGTGALACVNTDLPAVVQTLADAMACDVTALGGLRVIVLGAGGVARSAVAALADAGASVTVAARNPDRARTLAAAIGGSVAVSAAPADLDGARFDVIVNATPVGMTDGPDPGGLALPDGLVLDDTVTVFDTVYTPVRTPLVREAETRGARTVTGIDMFLRQAALQFELWTGTAAPLDAFHAALASAPG